MHEVKEREKAKVIVNQRTPQSKKVGGECNNV